MIIWRVKSCPRIVVVYYTQLYCDRLSVYLICNLATISMCVSVIGNMVSKSENHCPIAEGTVCAYLISIREASHGRNFNYPSDVGIPSIRFLLANFPQFLCPTICPTLKTICIPLEWWCLEGDDDHHHHDQAHYRSNLICSNLQLSKYLFYSLEFFATLQWAQKEGEEEFFSIKFILAN